MIDFILTSIYLMSMTFYYYFKKFNIFTNMNRYALHKKIDLYVISGSNMYNRYIDQLLVVFLLLLYLQNNKFFGVILAHTFILCLVKKNQQVLPFLFISLISYFLNKNIVTLVILLESISIAIMFTLVSNFFTQKEKIGEGKVIDIFLINIISVTILFYTMIFFFVKFNLTSDMYLDWLKPYILFYFIIKYGNISLYSSKLPIYEYTKPEILVRISFLQLLVIPFILSSYLPSISFGINTYTCFILFIVNIFSMNFLFFLQNIRHLVLYTSVLTNILTVLYLIC